MSGYLGQEKYEEKSGHNSSQGGLLSLEDWKLIKPFVLSNPHGTYGNFMSEVIFDGWKVPQDASETLLKIAESELKIAAACGELVVFELQSENSSF